MSVWANHTTNSLTAGALRIPAEESEAPWLPAFIAAVAAAAAGCQKIFDDDTFMHLAFGREMVKRGWWLEGEPFLYTVPADRWSPENYQSWGMQLVFYAAYALAGTAGIVWLQMVLVGATAFIFAVYASRRGASAWLAGMAALCMASLASFFLVHRPLLITPTLAGALLLCLRVINLPRLAGALFLQVWWANLHASFVLGFIIFVARFVEEIWPTRQSNKPAKFLSAIPPTVKYLALAAAAAPFLCLLNPAGWHLYKYIYELNTLDWLPVIINEWKPPEWDKARFQYFGGIVLGIWLLCAIALARRRYLPLTELILLAILCLMVCQARRFIVPTAFIAIAPAALAATALWPQRNRLRWLIIVLVAVGGFAILAMRIEALVTTGRMGFGLDHLRLPVAPAEWLKQNKISGPVACAPTVGGYLEWACPEIRPGTDGRCLANDGEIIRAFNALANNQANWQKAFPPAGAADVMVIENSYITDISSMRHEWAIVYWDELWEILVRRQGRWGYLAEQRDLTLSAPNMVAMLYDHLTIEEKREQERQLEEIIAAQPQLAVAYSCLGYVRYGQAMDALSELEKIEEAAQQATASNRAEEAANMAEQAQRIYQHANRRLREAIECYRRDAVLMPWQSRSFFGAGRCLLWLGKAEEAYRCFADAARIDPLNWLHAINSITNRLEYLKAKHGSRAPSAQEAEQLRERLRAAARAERRRILRVFRRMDKMAEIPVWLQE